jgi:hypothetical protein
MGALAVAVLVVVVMVKMLTHKVLAEVVEVNKVNRACLAREVGVEGATLTAPVLAIREVQRTRPHSIAKR